MPNSRTALELAREALQNSSSMVFRDPSGSHKRDAALSAIDQALASTLVEAAGEWRTIDSAPQTGRTLLLGYFNVLGKWRTLRGQWFTDAVIQEEWTNSDVHEAGWFETSVECDEEDNGCWPCDPTHWMPLPAAPGVTPPVQPAEPTSVISPESKLFMLDKLARGRGFRNAAEALASLPRTVAAPPVLAPGEASEQKIEPPSDDAAFSAWETACEVDGIKYDGAAFERGYELALSNGVPEWPTWANQILAIVREHSGYDGYDDQDGVDLVEETRECLRELAAMADRARAELRARDTTPSTPQAPQAEASEHAENILNSWLDNQHPDDAAIDAFASKMRQKMAASRAKGRGGWNDKSQCSAEILSAMLRSHVGKGDPVDVANFAMMLAQRGERIASTPQAEAVAEVREDKRSGKLFIATIGDADLSAGDKLYAATPTATTEAATQATGAAQEPVAWMRIDKFGNSDICGVDCFEAFPVYRAAALPAEPLTKLWIDTLSQQNGWDGGDGAPSWLPEIVRAVEWAHGIGITPKAKGRAE